MTRLDSEVPVRGLRTSRRCLTGQIASTKGGAASFESSLERDWLELLDFEPSVTRIQVQPFVMVYTHEGKRRRYTPDVLVERADSRTWVYEVKPQAELEANWTMYRPRFRAAVAYCRQHEARFKIVTERHIRTPLLENARFLRRYRAFPPAPDLRSQVLSTLSAVGPTTPEALVVATFWAQTNRTTALAMLWHLIAIGLITTDLQAPLTMQSRIELVRK